MNEHSTRTVNVFMDQNNKCNLRCLMCGFSDPRVEKLTRYDMPSELFAKIAADVFPRANYLALSCLTEPFMTRDFLSRLDLVKRYAVPVTEIITNGTLLNTRRIRKLIEIPISRIGISLDGATARTYESIRIGAKFTEVLNNIRLLQEMKRLAGSDLPALRLIHVLSEKNVHEFAGFLDLAESLGVSFIDVRTVIPFTNARDQGTDEESFWTKVAECRQLLESWKQCTGVGDLGYLRPHREPGNLYDESGERRQCRVIFDNITIQFNGDVVPCMAWERPPLGNLATQTLDEILAGPALRAARREWAEKKPGVDCRYCQITRERPEQESDHFYKILRKELV